MSDIAVCVPMFMRSSKLRTLLASAERSGIEKVYVADDGETTDAKEAIYSADYGFELEVFDLEYDAGVGHKRNVLGSEPDEPYLLFVDSDMQVPPNYMTLYRQLEALPDLGGVTPMYLEDGRISTVSTDLYEEGDRLHRDIRERKEIETVADAPLVEFDFLPNVGLFRKRCLEEYNWDEEYTIMREHLDFYVGHWKRTDWRFGLCPQVLIPHSPGGSEEYVSHRRSEEKFRRSDEYFCRKWNYREVVRGADRWVDTYDPDIGGFPPGHPVERLMNAYEKGGAIGAAKYAGSYVFSGK